MKVLKKRIYSQLDSAQLVEQAGFRKNFATVDHIHTINRVLERANEYQMGLHSVFVDFRKAFDTVIPRYLWEGLISQGVSKWAIRTLMEYYKDTKAYVKLDREGPI